MRSSGADRLCMGSLEDLDAALAHAADERFLPAGLAPAGDPIPALQRRLRDAAILQDDRLEISVDGGNIVVRVVGHEVAEDAG